MNLYLQITRYLLLSSTLKLNLLKETLFIIISNLINKSNEIKYKEIKYSNSILNNNILNLKGGLELLKLIGFNLIEKENLIKYFIFDENYFNKLNETLNWIK